MTTYEHAMVGITGSLAAGLHRRYGWPIVAMAAAAAVVPDWDSLSILFGAAAFDCCHRAWGHSVFTASLAGVLVAAIEHRFRFSVRLARAFQKDAEASRPPAAPPSVDERSTAGLGLWIVVGILAALSHLLADLVVSGTETLAPWELQLLWPVSKRGWGYPVIQWGDPWPTLIFIAGMFALARWRTAARPLAGATLLVVLAYIALRAVSG